jgi:hypothetical protein
MRRKLIVEKKGTTTTTAYSESDSESDSYLVDTDFTETEEGRQLFQSIVNSDYVKPQNGSIQDNMTIDDIKDKLKGFIPLKSMDQKKVLKKMPIFRTYVRYINSKTKQFRTGGMLTKVEYPDYIVLANTSMKLSWSVQLKDNIIFIRDPRIEKEERPKPKTAKEEEKIIKEKLFSMYKNGDLKRILRK